MHGQESLACQEGYNLFFEQEILVESEGAQMPEDPCVLSQQRCKHRVKLILVLFVFVVLALGMHVLLRVMHSDIIQSVDSFSSREVALEIK